MIWAIQPDGYLVSRRPAVLQAGGPTRALVVPADEAQLWLGAPCYELGVPETYERIGQSGPTWAGRMYAEAKVRRIVAEEHTALLTRQERERLQSRFIARNALPGDPTMLSATPTLELGIDIGDLSTVALCSVPPAQANYIQRIGRAGRRDGNAFTVTLAAAQPHDLYFYQDPLEMLDGAVSPPGVFLNASAVLERQLTAFCLDNWSATCNDTDAVPKTVRPLLDRIQSQEESGFPYTFFDYICQNQELLLRRFLSAFKEDLEEDSRTYLSSFLKGTSGHAPTLVKRILDRLEHRVEERTAIERDVRRISKTIRVLRRRPQDEATKLNIDQHTRERLGLRRLLRKINSADTFSWLTDEGLIPNYAFPQEGVKLRSVILRSQPTEQAGWASPQNTPLTLTPTSISARPQQRLESSPRTTASMPGATESKSTVSTSMCPTSSDGGCARLAHTAEESTRATLFRPVPAAATPCGLTPARRVGCSRSSSSTQRPARGARRSWMTETTANRFSSPTTWSRTWIRASSRLPTLFPNPVRALALRTSKRRHSAK